MIDLKDIYKALRDELLADGDLMSVITGVHTMQAPARAAFPYVLLRHVAADQWETFRSGATGESVIMQCSVLSQAFPDVAEVIDIIKRLTNVLDEAELAFGGYRHMRCERLSVEILEQPQDKLYHGVVRYRITVER